MTIESLDEKECSGCGACVQACPANCIRLVRNMEGFDVPKIIGEKCLNCGVCARTCPQMSSVIRYRPMSAYAARCKDEELLRTSSSGGIFGVLARIVIGEKGSVYGSAMISHGNTLRTEHLRIVKACDIAKLQGSKYVQSKIGDTYIQAREDIKQGQKVLFTGTPCQIAGLYSFLGERPNQLTTCEIICHGVPSPLLFEKYIQYLSDKVNGRIKEYLFRTKTFGWGLYYYYYYYYGFNKNNNYSKQGIADSSSYYQAFLKGAAYRECCYRCKYAAKERVADITVGDYWGVELQHPEFACTRGVSCVLINTAQGNKLWQESKDQMKAIETKFDFIAKGNDNLTHPTLRPECRGTAYRYIHESAGVIFNNKPYKIGFRAKTTGAIKRCIPLRLKWKMKRMLQKIKR